MTTNWTFDWPTEPGSYWFYGWRYGLFHEEPEMHFVKGWKVPDGTMLIITGQFMYRGDRHFGKFTPASLPTPPEIERPEEEGA